MAFSDKKAALDFINNYQKEKYDRITVMAAKGKKRKISIRRKSKRLEFISFYNGMC